ncbi:MAG TPA: hypothetical protein VMU22_09785, partial [Rhizomicrobium sp.]|nr:hypothetical protein [Rhizomicrobium sp.]
MPTQKKHTAVRAADRKAFRLRTYLLTTAAVGAITLGAMTHARANPANPTSPPAVVNAPTYNGLGTTNLTVNLNQPRTIIDWGSYNINSGETTSYMFGASHNSWIVLNRVNNGSATINGRLQGCLADCTTFGGNIWIYASDGVVIGNGAVVNTGGFLATTSPLATSDSDFANGTEAPSNKFVFGPAAAGTSVQIGSANITGYGGTLAFIAPQVTTASGATITAPNGDSSVLYGAATSYSLQFASNPNNDFDLVTFDVPAGGGSGSTTPINIQGATKAGNVYVAAVTASSVANAMISVGGEQTATQASSVGGDIVLSAGGGISNGQAVAASGGSGTVNATVTGTVQADTQVALNATGSVDASGAAITGSTNNAATTLTGSTNGGADVSNSGNQISAVTGFTNTGSGDVKITSGTALDVTGAISNTGGDITLTTTGTSSNGITFDAGLSASGSVNLFSAGGITENAGATVSGSGLTGTSVGDTNLTQSGNSIGSLNAFIAGGSFSFTNAGPLAVNGTDTTGLVGTSGITATNGNITLATQFGVIALNTDVTAYSAGGSQSVTLTAGGGIAQIGGIIKTNVLSGSSVGNANLLQNNVVDTLSGFNAGGSFSFIDASALTITGSILAGTGISDTGNIFIGPPSITFSGANPIALTPGANGTVSLVADTLSFNQTVTVGGATFEYAPFTAGSAVTLGGDGVLSNADLIIDASTIRVGAATVPGSGLVTTAGSITVSGDGFDAGGANLDLETTGAVTQTGALTNVGTLSGNAASLDLENTSNTIAAVGPFTATTGDFTLVDSTALDITGSLTSTSGNITLTTTGLGTGSGNDITLDAGLTAGTATGTQSVGLFSSGAVTENANGSVTAGFLTGTSVGDTSLTQTNSVGTLNAFQSGGNFYLADGVGLTVDGTDATGLVGANGINASGNIFLQTPDPSGITFSSANTPISVTAGGTVSLQADALTFDAPTTVTANAFEYAPNTFGATVTLGAGSVLSNANFTIDASEITIGGITSPLSGLTETAGEIDVTSAINVPNAGLALIATSSGGGTGNINISAPITAAAFTAGTVTADPGGTITFNDSIDVPLVSTANGQEYFDAVVLAADTTLKDTGAVTEIAFNGTVDDATAGTAKLDVEGNAAFIQNVGGSAALSSLSVTGTTQVVASGSPPFASITVATTGDQTYTGAVELGQPTLGGYTFSSGGLVDFAGGITVASAGNYAMEVLGNAEFGGSVGNAAAPVTSIEVTGSTDLNGATIVTGGGQSYGGAVTLASDTTLADESNGASINFASTIDATSAGSAGLTVNMAASGTATFTGDVGTGHALKSLTVDAGTIVLGGDVTTQGNLSLNGTGLSDLFIGNALTSNAGNITLQTSSGDILLGANLTASNNDGQIVTLESGSGIAQVGGLITADVLTGSSVLDAELTSPLNLVGTLGAFQAGGNFTLVNNEALTVSGADDSNLGFTGVNAGANGSGNLELTTLTGDLTLSGNLTTGHGVSSGVLLVSAGAIDQTSGTISAPDLTGSSVGDTSLMDGNSVAVLEAFKAGGNFAFNNISALTVDGTDVTGLVGERGLNAGGNIFLEVASPFGITFSSTSPVTVTPGADSTLSLMANTLVFPQHTTFSGGVVEFAPYTVGSTLTLGEGGLFLSNVTFSGNPTLRVGAVTEPGQSTLTTTAGAITVAPSIGYDFGGVALDLETTGAVTGGPLSGVTRLTGNAASLDLESASNAIGNIGTFTTTGAFTLVDSSALTISGALNVGSLMLTDSAAGGIALDSGVTSAGGQTYNSPVTLDADTLLTSTAGGNIDFGSTLNGTFALETSTSGATIFGGAVGAPPGAELASLTVDAGGTATQINGGLINTTGQQSYNSAVVLGADTTLTSTSGQAITFDSTVNGAHALTTETTGTTTFGGEVGVGTNNALSSLSVAGYDGTAGGTTIDTDQIATTGLQSYSGDVTLAHDTTLSSTGGGTVSFGSNIDGPYSLTTDTTGATTFYYLVGANTPLTSLTIEGPTTIQSTGIATSGAQIYEGAVTLNADATLTGTTVTFESSLNGNHALDIEGDASFDNGSTGSIGSLSVSGTVTFDGSLTTSGSQTYSGAVTLATDETLTSTGGDIDFQSTLNGAHNLSVNAASGTITFGDVVGGGTPLTSLTAEGLNVVVDSNITAANSIFLKGSGLTFAGGTIETFPTGTVSLEADTLAFNNPTTVFADTLEYAPFSVGTTVTLGSGGVLPATNLTVNASTLRVGAVTDPVTSTLDMTAGSIVIAPGGYFSPAANLDLETTGAISGGSLSALGLSGNAASVSLTGFNQILGIGSFTSTGDFALNDGAQLAVTGPLTSTHGNIFLSSSALTLDGDVTAYGSGSQIVTLEGGAITQTGGSLSADELTGQALSVSLTSSTNKVGTLEAFNTLNGFALTDSIALTVAGNTLSTLSILPGVNANSGDIALTTVGNGNDLTIAGELAAYNAGQAVSLNASGNINQTSGNILASELTGSAGGSVTLGGVSSNLDLIGSLGAFAAGGNFVLIDQSALTVIGAVSSTNGNIGIQTVGSNAGITIATGGSLSATGSGTQVVLLQSAGAITETGSGTTAGSISADELMMLSVGDTTLLSGNNQVATLEGVLALGNFYLSDASALSVAGDNVSFGSFNLPITNITAGAGGAGNVFLESANASGVTFGPNHPVTLSASTNGLVSVQADSLTFDNGTAFVGGTFEYAPATTGATASLGGGGGLVSNDVAFGVNLVRIGAVTEPGSGETTTAGAISVDGAFDASGKTLDLETTGAVGETMFGVVYDVGTLTGNAASLDLTTNSNGISNIGTFTTTGSFALTDSAAVAFTGTLQASQLNLNDSSGITLAGVSVSTSGSQDYNGPVTVGPGAEVISTNGGAITFESTIDGGNTLTTDTAGTTEFKGEVGFGTALAGLTVDGPATIDTDFIRTTGTQTYSGAVTLLADTTLASMSGTVDFASTIEGTQALMIDGNASFNADVGDSASLTSLTVIGATTFDGTLTTSGNQKYNGAVTLDTDQTLTSTGGSIEFDSTVDAATPGAEGLTVSAANGLVTFYGAVGGVEDLKSLSVTANALTLTGAITTQNNLLLDVTGSSPVAINGALTSNTGDITLETGSGDLVLNASVTASNNDGQIVTLVSGGMITQTNGGIVADELTGSANGDARLQDAQNSVATLDAFEVGGTFDLQTGFFSGRSLTVAGNDVSGLGFSGVTAGFGHTTGSVFIGDSGALTLTGNVTAESTGGSQAVGLEGQSVNQTGGIITANSLSAVGLSSSVTLDQANQVGVLTGSFAEGDFSFVDTEALTVNNSNPFGLQFSGVAAGYNNVTHGNLTLQTTGTGNGITLAGDLQASNGHAEIVTLTSAAGINQTGGTITADELTGSAAGDVSLTSSANAIGTLATWTDPGFAFSLTDSVALTMTGTLDPTVATLVDTGGGIDASGSAIIADELTGSAAGNAIFTNAGNQIGTLESFRTTGDFSLTDSTALTVEGSDVSSLGFTGVTAGLGGMTGNLTLTTLGAGHDLTLDGNVTAQSGNARIMTLVSAGGIDQTGGAIAAGELTGSSVDDTTLTQSGNFVLGLEAFRAGGNFSLTEGTTLLTVYGTDVSSLGFTGVTAGYGNTVGDITLRSLAAPIFLQGNLTAPATVDLETVGEINQTGGIITANKLTGSVNGGPALLNDGNLITTLGDFSAVGELQLTNAQALTVAGTVSESGGILNLTTTSGDLTITGMLSSNAGPITLTSAGKIDESAGTINSPYLTGSSNQDAIFTGDNSIGVLIGFTVNNSGNFTLLDNSALTVGGNVSAPGNIFIGTAAGEGLTTGSGIALTSTGNGLVSFQTDSLTIDAGTTITGSTFEYAPTTAGTTVTLGSGAANFSNATLDVSTVRIGAVTEPGATSFTTTAGAITVADNQDFGGVNLDLETTGAVTGTAGAITNVGELTGSAASVDLSDSSNTINSLGNFSTGANAPAYGNFILADSAALSIKGALNAGGSEVDLILASTLDENGGTGTITAGELTGQSGQATLTGQNVISTLGDFNSSGSDFTLNNTVPLSVAGTLQSGIGSVTLTDSGNVSISGTVNAYSVDLELGTNTVDEDNATGSITAISLTGNSGQATLTGANVISSVGDYNTHGGDFTLDTASLIIGGPLQTGGGNVKLTAGNVTITGVIDAGSGEVDLELGTHFVDENSGDGSITAGELTGNSGAAAFDGHNVVSTLGDFNTHGQNFKLDNTVALSISGAVNAGGSAVDLELGTNTVDEDGGTGFITAGYLTGNSGQATLDGHNVVSTLGGFNTNGQNFKLDNTVALSISGAVNAGGSEVDLELGSNAVSESGAGTITAGELKGNSGTTTLLGLNAVASLGDAGGGDYNSNGGNFALNNTVALTVAGTLESGGGNVLIINSAPVTISGAINAGGSEVDLELGTNSVDENGGTGTITAGYLTGNSGEATLTGANAVATLGNFDTNGQNFKLDNTVALSITGALNAGGSEVDLELGTNNVDEDGGVGTITAGYLTGNSGQATLTGANVISSLGDFNTHNQNFTLDNTVALSISGAVNAGGSEVDLEQGTNNVDEDGGTGFITAGYLTGNSGQVTLTGANAVSSLGDFNTHGQNFTLDNTVALSISGTLNVGGSGVDLELGSNNVDEAGGTGLIEAGYLTGNSGQAMLTGANVISSLGDFDTHGQNFTLDNTVALSISGHLDVGGSEVDLEQGTNNVDEDGGTGFITAGYLTGNSGQATLDGHNVVSTLGDFNTNGQNFKLDNTIALSISGTVNAGGSEVDLELGTNSVDEDGATGAIEAGELAGTTGEATLDGANAVATLGNFDTNNQNFKLVDTVPLIISGALNAGGSEVDLELGTNTVTENGTGTITAGYLTGTSGEATLDGANAVATLGNFDTNGQNFKLDNTVALSISGALNAGGSEVDLELGANSVDEDGGTGTITAGYLTGNSGQATLTGANVISSLGNFDTHNQNFTLDDTVALSISGAVNAGGSEVDLELGTNAVDEDGGTGTITAGYLTGNSGQATLTGANAVSSLGDFNTHGQNFTLDNTVALSISGTLNVGGSDVDLELGTNTVDEDGGTGLIEAGYLTGNSGQATLTGANAVSSLGDFNT